MMLNIQVRNPNACHTGITVGGMEDGLFINNDFFGKRNESACPVFEGIGK